MRENVRKLEDQISNFNVRKRGREKRKWEEIISEIIKENLLDLKREFSDSGADRGYSAMPRNGCTSETDQIRSASTEEQVVQAEGSE